MKVRAGPGGLHLFDRTSGVNILLDEVAVYSSRWSRSPQQVSVALTNACDLSCPFCYAPKSRAVLDRALLLTWLKQLDDEGCLGVGFGGGEPTLYPGFAELCTEVAAGTRLAVTITSHAHRLTRDMAERVRGSVHFIRISVDGVGATYEQFRGRPWARLLDQISIARDIAPFGINFVVNADTVSDLSEALEISEQLGASEFLLLPEQPTKHRPGIDPMTLQNMISFVNSYQGSVQLAISEAGANLVPTCSGSAEVGLRSYAHIDASGTLRSTSYSRSGVPLQSENIMPALSALYDLEASQQ